MASYQSLRSRALFRHIATHIATRDQAPPRAALPMKTAIILALKNGTPNIVASLSATVCTVFTNNQVVVVFCICVIAACMFGLVGSILAHWLPGVCSTDLSDKKRWVANSLGSLFIAPIATWYLHDRWFPDAPVEFLAFFCAGVVGTFFVSAILIIPQWWLKKNGFIPPTPPAPKPPTDTDNAR